MLKNKKIVYFCQECGYESSKWMGQCPGCKAWNTLVEETISTKKGTSSGIGSFRNSGKRPEPVRLKDISLSEDERQLTKIGELDRVLGGGIVPGSLVLVGGDPGIGKSTLLLQVCRNLAQSGRNVLYISGEESLHQIKLRAERIGEFNENLQLLCETNLETIREVIERKKPDMVVIDSIQTMFHEDISSAPGSVSQVRESTNILMQIAKGQGVSVFIVGHVTKEGNVAGPRVLEHMVDTVLYFEGDRHASYRILRAVKNRFGSTNEIGVFEMRNTGLEEVKNPSEFMLNGKPSDTSGSIVACSMEGTRPILVEIQALVCQSNFGIPRRTAVGTDFNRVNLLMAVLEKKVGICLASCDAYVNIAGGMKMTEPAIDLGIALAVVSSCKDIIIPDSVMAFGEIGLSGEVRAVSMAGQRVAEAKKLGFETVILPEVCRSVTEKIKGIRLVYVSWIQDAIRFIMQNISCER
ncbi:DNA repair protein RadA [Blautia sp. MSK17_66]|uniref:DNA repair protein RadA n=1 Tax=Blautia TaxID=572511 RepID=UPI00156FF41C|nr:MULTISPECIES: DNA repair protein RadA [Blautia]MCB5549168.1 DNA repair protein RadA [Blautia sp. MSK17_66]NSK00954.1 DNA repair protein RadA [Blautia obeum]